MVWLEGRILKFHANPLKLYTIQRAMKNWATFVKTPHGYLLWYAWYGGLNGSNYEIDKNIQRFITFRKSNEFEKSFRDIVVEGQYFIFAS